MTHNKNFLTHRAPTLSIVNIFLAADLGRVLVLLLFYFFFIEYCLVNQILCCDPVKSLIFLFLEKRRVCLVRER